MHASLHSARLAPKKANLMAKMVRGLPVPTALELLRKTHKKSARLIEGVVRSAVANAEHNMKQDAQTMIVKTIVVNQGTAYRRGVPMARGRVRPIRKYLCHIEVTLGFAEQKEERGSSASLRASKRKVESEKANEKASQKKDSPVKALATTAGKVNKSSDSSASSVSSVSSS